MATGSGLDAQLGLGIESAWGTAVTPTRFLEFTSESMTMEPTFLEPAALRAGTKFKRGSRVRQSRRTVSGDLTVEHGTKGMGLLWKHALGSALVSPAQIASTTAYEQSHKPGDYRGLGLTVQVGRPEPSTGVVRPMTYAGCKCASWSFAVRDQDIPALTLTLDGRNVNEGMALATAAYISGATVFDFSQAQLKLGGTVTTTAGKTSVSGGIAVATIVTEFTVGGDTPMATERYGLGNAGLKAEPLENGTPTVTGSLGAEFNKAELYDLFTNNTTVPMQFLLTGDVIGVSGANDLLEITMPAVKLKSAAPNVGGPDILTMSTDFEAYSNEVDPVIQVRVVSSEATL